MPSLTATLFKSPSGIYYMKWKDANGREQRMSLRTRDRDEAKRLSDEQSRNLRSAHYTPHSKTMDFTLESAMARYKRLRALSPKAIFALDRALFLFEHHIGPMRVADLKKAHILEFRRILADDLGYKPAYITRLESAIRATLNTLVDADLIDSHPLTGLKALKKRRGRPRYLDWSDCLRLVDTAQSPFPQAAFILGAFAGLRLQEIRVAKVEYINHAAARMWVDGDKTDSSADDVPYHPALAERLNALLPPTGYIVLENGKRPTLSRMNEVFHETARAANVDIPKGIAWHILRHSFAVHLVRDLGYTLEQLAPLLRHSDYKQVTALYADIRAMRGSITSF